MINTLLNANQDVLGLNWRNQKIIRQENPSSAKQLADDKLRLKKKLGKYDIPTPTLFKIVKRKEQIPHIDWESMPKSFVLKPNKGTGGQGIVVFYGKKKGALEWIRPDMSTMTKEQIENHISDILDGRYSMGGRKDTAFFEERIINHPVLKPYSYKGIPDVRIIVYNGVPIMAELRLPTRESRGTANLHAGGIGVGIDMATGITTVAIHRKGFDLIGDRYDIIEETLDEPKLPLRGLKVPYWNKIMEMSIRCQKLSGAGFLGVDIAIDRIQGPVVFEINARPGLAIQLANMAGLRERIERVKRLKVKTVTRGIKIAKTLFGGVIEEEVESLTGKQVIGMVEKVTCLPAPKIEPEEEIETAPAVSADTSTEKTTPTLKPKTKKRHRKKRRKGAPEKEIIKAKIDTGALHSSIDRKLAFRLGYKELREVSELFETPPEGLNEARKHIIPYKEKAEDLKQIDNFTIIKSGNGVSIRPIIEVETIISGEQKTIRFTVSDRSDLIYPAIIGRRDLKDFIIDPSKTFVLSSLIKKDESKS